MAKKKTTESKSDGKKTFWIDEGWPENIYSTTEEFQKKAKIRFNDKKVRKGSNNG